MMEIAVICAALLALLVFGVGLYLSVLRGRTGTVSYFAVPSRNETKTPLARAQRAQGNTSEYAPLLALLILFAGGQPTVEAWWVWCMIGIVLVRFLVVAGFIWGKPLDESDAGRAIGAFGTYVLGTALTIGVLIPYLQDLMG